jgi:hypothetical protein
MIARVVLIVLAIGSAIVPTVTSVSAGGPGDNPSCLVPNPPGGATALRGTVAVGVQNASPNVTDNVDFTLRLERGGALAFFRASVPMQVYATSNEGILCTLLDRTNPDPAASDLQRAILSTFGFPSTGTFWLTDKSVSKAEIQGPGVNQWLCNDTFTPTTPMAPPASCQVPPRAASMADVVIYVK